MSTSFRSISWVANRVLLTMAVASLPLLRAQTNDTSASDPNSPAATESAPAATDPSSTSSGGWKRVGEGSSVYTPDANNSNTSTAAPSAPVDPSLSGRSSYPTIGQSQNAPDPQYQSQYPQNQPQQRAYAPPSVPAQLTVQPGTYITVRINQALSSDKNQVGDGFMATLLQPVVVNGIVVAEPGQTFSGHVVMAQHHSSSEPGRLAVALNDMTLVDGQHLDISTQFVGIRGGTTPGGQQVGTVATTTGAGAVIGAIAGGGSGAAIGAGAGAFAGLLGVMITRNHASVIYPEQILTFKVQAPASFSTVNSAQAFRYVQSNDYNRPSSGGGQWYQSAAPAVAPVYPYYGGYYGYGYGYGYPYYWGPTVGIYGGWGGWYGGRGWYGGGRGFYGGGGWRGGRR